MDQTNQAQSDITYKQSDGPMLYASAVDICKESAADLSHSLTFGGSYPMNRISASYVCPARVAEIDADVAAARHEATKACNTSAATRTPTQEELTRYWICSAR